LRRALAKLIYPEEFDLNDKLLKVIGIHKKENSSLKLEVDILSRMIEKLNKLIKNEYEVLGIEKTGHGEWIIIFSNADYIYVGQSHGFYNDHVLSLAYSITPDNKRIIIDDIQTTRFNKGYGSFAMKYLFELAHKLKVEAISGWISHVDWDHIDRLKRFYEKHGFNVKLNHETREGRIKWVREEK
jgi:hypothetical protein